ncbi:uncharacterized protein LOC129005040 [Macrosteles quadrilineatus]|uniref:uncharacterized protein LOC129005040 n=1 Tax=Macrosteles quadrilineatus TaxID=74068 RepID=UPI0023E1C452|nr:uncharacterized protein LOC129005040 [Macrosteles quadrilineatus]
MAGNYLIAGVVGIVFAVGVALYEAFKERESRKERQYDFYGQNRKEYLHRDPRSPPVQKQAVCGSCRGPLAKENIDRLSCGHIFHSRCIAGKNYCPFCQKLIETPRSTASSPLPEVKCDSCNTQVGSNELAKLNCDHEVHKDCLKMGFCPMPRCTYLRSMKEHRW